MMRAQWMKKANTTSNLSNREKIPEALEAAKEPFYFIAFLIFLAVVRPRRGGSWTGVAPKSRTH